MFCKGKSNLNIINMRQRLLLTGILGTVCSSFYAENKLPNIVLINMDDMGYADVEHTGGKVSTPNINRISDEGITFTQFYTASSASSASRAALMTGCYPERVGINWVLDPESPIGLNPNEIIIPELLKQKDYNTVCIGKWHLGDKKGALPTSHGFDEFYGLKYSHDMRPRHLVDGENVLKEVSNNEIGSLTKDLTDKTLEYIEKYKDSKNPFFIYYASPLPHVPLGVSKEFNNISGKGLYYDVITEIDYSIGRLLNKLDEYNLTDNTLVIFISDNGPWLLFGNHGGSSGVFREGKATTFDGGQHLMCFMRWPKKIKEKSICNAVISNMDILPTLAAITETKLSENYIDGKNIYNLMRNKSKRSPHKDLFFLLRNEVQAIRSGKWKLHIPHKYWSVNIQGNNGKMGNYKTKNLELSLYDLENDPSESINLAKKYPKIANKMMNKIKRFQNHINIEKREAGRY